MTDSVEVMMCSTAKIKDIKNYIMKKVIRLTESDLTRIVRRVVEEVESSNGYSNLEKCATTSFQNKYEVSDTGGQYAFSMYRKNQAGDYITIDSQQNPDIVSVRRVTGKDRNERVVYGGELKFKGKSCMELEREINNLLSKRITPN